MSNKYQLFLEQIEVIPEDLFMDVVNSFPEFNIEEVDFDECDSQDYIAKSILDYLLADGWSYAFADYINFENKEFEVLDVDSLEDLEEIRENFPKWSIVNYDDIKDTLEKEEKEKEKENEFRKKMTLFTELAEKISLEQVENIVNNYDNEG